MPTAPPRVCATCGTPGCTAHRTSWASGTVAERAAKARQLPRITGRRLQALRHQLLRAQPFCQRCRVECRDLQRDHIVPLCAGGRDIPSNTQMLCARCHAAKTARELRAQRG